MDPDFLEFFKNYCLSKEKNPELFLEKIKALYTCTMSPKVHWCFFDLETCHINPKGDIRDGTIIEIGAICDDKVFSKLCNPGHRINNTSIHGISDDDVKYKGMTKLVLKEFFEWLQSFRKDEQEVVVLVAHNGATFDRKVLLRHITNMNLEKPKGVYIADSLYVVKSLLEIKKGGLEVAYRKVFGDEYIEKHRAYEDSNDLKRLMEYISEKHSKTYLELFKHYLYNI